MLKCNCGGDILYREYRDLLSTYSVNDDLSLSGEPKEEIGDITEALFECNKCFKQTSIDTLTDTFDAEISIGRVY